MSTYLITGANRGIGLELTRQALAQGHRVIATCRNPKTANELTVLDGELDVLALDVADAAATISLARELNSLRCDVLINNAGIMAAKQSVDDMDYDEWALSFEVNAIAPWRVATSFKQQLQRSSAARVVTLTSQMGSLERAGSDRVAYRSSKAAANMAMKTLALEWKPSAITVCMLHPGWVRTDMGGSNAAIGTTQSASGLLNVIEGLSIADTGCFFDQQGAVIPW